MTFDFHDQHSSREASSLAVSIFESVSLFDSITMEEGSTSVLPTAASEVGLCNKKEAAEVAAACVVEAAALASDPETFDHTMKKVMSVWSKLSTFILAVLNLETSVLHLWISSSK